MPTGSALRGNRSSDWCARSCVRPQRWSRIRGGSAIGVTSMRRSCRASAGCRWRSPQRFEQHATRWTALLRYTGAKLIEAACVRIPVHRDAIGLDGLIGDPEIRIHTNAAITMLLDAV